MKNILFKILDESAKTGEDLFLAVRTDYGVTFNMVARWENGTFVSGDGRIDDIGTIVGYAKIK